VTLSVFSGLKIDDICGRSRADRGRAQALSPFYNRNGTDAETGRR
jgi:hypothetical protein